MLAMVFIATSIYAYAEVANVSRAAGLINFGYLLFVPTALIVLGLRSVMVLLLTGLVANLAINWGLYWALPTIGVFD